MKVTVLEGKKEFSIYGEEELITAMIEALKESYEENSYVEYGTSPEFGESDFSYISKEVYMKNIEKFKEEFSTIMTKDYLEGIIKNWNRKKNGSFNRKNTKELCSCDNCIVIHEWHNTWIYYVVKVIAKDDYNLEIVLFKKTDTPC